MSEKLEVLIEMMVIFAKELCSRDLSNDVLS